MHLSPLPPEEEEGRGGGGEGQGGGGRRKKNNNDENKTRRKKKSDAPIRAGVTDPPALSKSKKAREGGRQGEMNRAS